MAGSQEVRLRHLIAGAELEATIDKELQQWTDARDRLHDVGAALIAVSTPVSENLGQETVASALAAFKAVGEKVNERADDIQEIHQALRHAVLVTRQAQTAVAEMDGDQRDKPEFGNGEPPTDEADEMHDLKVYVGQMKLYNSWADARETKSQEHADKVETAWQDAIAVMEKIPDDQTSSGGGGGGGGGGTGPIMPTAPDGAHHPHRPHDPRRHVGGRTGPRRSTPPRPSRSRRPDAHTDPHTGAAGSARPGPRAGPAGRWLPPDAVPPGHAGHAGPRPGPRSLPRLDSRASPARRRPATSRRPRPSRRARSAATPSAAPPASVRSVASAPASGPRARRAASGGLRSGGTLGASARTAGSAKGSLGARTGGTAAGGAASGRGHRARWVARGGRRSRHRWRSEPAVVAARTRTRRSGSPPRSSCSTRTRTGSTTRARAPE